MTFRISTRRFTGGFGIALVQKPALSHPLRRDERAVQLEIPDDVAHDGRGAPLRERLVILGRPLRVRVAHDFDALTFKRVAGERPSKNVERQQGLVVQPRRVECETHLEIDRRARTSQPPSP